MRLDALHSLTWVVFLFAVACAEPAPPPSVAKAPVPRPTTPFSYAGNDGPEHWGDLDPKFARCKTGSRQSPIDLPAVAPSDSHFTITRPTYGPTPLVVRNNGHTVEIKNTVDNAVDLNGVKYNLVQFHFHMPSEHTIGGRSFDAELHFVHQSADGNLLVIAVMFTKGAENKLLAPIWRWLPTTVTDQWTPIPDVSMNLRELLPVDLRFEHYDGSLTVPPCTEAVSWFVAEPSAKEPLHLSADQISQYRALMGGPTNRPLQPLNGRAVVEAIGPPI
jgi:carbonic anhydrase